MKTATTIKVLLVYFNFFQSFLGANHRPCLSRLEWFVDEIVRKKFLICYLTRPSAFHAYFIQAVRKVVCEN